MSFLNIFKSKQDEKDDLEANMPVGSTWIIKDEARDPWVIGQNTPVIISGIEDGWIKYHPVGEDVAEEPCYRKADLFLDMYRRTG